MIRKILIANRGEIACRIMRTARAMGIKTVAVVSAPDATSRHARMADEVVHIGGDTAATSYLDTKKIITAAVDSGADALHPGYGFLSENPEFVEAVAAAGIIFIGPSAKAIRAMGLKDKARQLMARAGVPVVPGYDGTAQDDETLSTAARDIGYPVMIKARAGGGGKGMRRVDGAKGFLEALQATRREAAASFGDGSVVIEKFIDSPRHIEVQIFADGHGNIVHLFERDCTLQRRHQKIIEEAPAPDMTDEMRAAMTKAAITAAEAINYHGAGTVEFIVDGAKGLTPDGFWFMEMNTRLQVEHPVTEAITGYDLVAWQIAVANGLALPVLQEDIQIRGHAVEARLYAEDAEAGFLPAPGVVSYAEFAQEVRVDTGINAPDTISPFYDPLMAKMITHAPSREAAFKKLAEALAASHLMGTANNISFLVGLVQNEDVLAMKIDTVWIDRTLDQIIADLRPSDDEIAQIVLAEYGALGGFEHGTAWRIWGQGASLVRLEIGEAIIEGRVVREKHDEVLISLGDSMFRFTDIVHDDDLRFRSNHGAGVLRYVYDSDQLSVAIDSGRQRNFRVNRIDPLAATLEAAAGNVVIAPMTGVITVIDCAEGDNVVQGAVLVRMEAMKMEHALVAPCAGVVSAIHYQVGDTVADAALLITIEPQS